MIVCPICESENEDGQLNCLLCGGDLPQPEAIKKTEESPSLANRDLLGGTADLSTTAVPPQKNMVTGTTPSLHTETNTTPVQAPPPPTPVNTEPPPPGTLCLIVYFQRRPANYFPVIYDEILIGRTDPASNSYPDLDVTPYDPELAISRKHAYLYREGDKYYIYPISNSGTQVNQEMVDIGVKKLLKEGDVIILSGRLAIRFAPIPAQP